LRSWRAWYFCPAVVRRFVDSADPEEIRSWVAQAAASGVTVGKAVQPAVLLRDVCAFVTGPIVIDAIATDRDGLVGEARALASIASNVVIRLPATAVGIEVVRTCAAERIATALAAGATPAEALAAARAGAAYISALVGRIDGVDGTDVIRKTVALLKTYDMTTTEVLAGAIRHPSDLVDAALAGARVASVPPAVLRQL
jgi:transaldolase